MCVSASTRELELVYLFRNLDPESKRLLEQEIRKAANRQVLQQTQERRIGREKRIDTRRASQL